MTDRADNFNRTNNASSLGTPSDSGAGWQVLGGTTWGIFSNTAYNPGSSAGHAFCCLESSISNVDVQVTIASAVGAFGVSVRVSDGTNGFFVYGTTAALILYKMVAGSLTQIGSTYTGTVASGDVIRVTVDGSSNWTVYLNGVSRITGTDSFQSTATLHGLYTTSANAQFDTFSAAALSSNTAVNPGAGTVTLTGYAPTVDRTQSVSPGAATVTLTGPAPSVSYSISLTPDPATVTLTSPAPTVVRTTDGPSVSPDVASVALTGYAPSLDNGIVLSANNEAYDVIGYVTLTGYRPRVANQAYDSGIAGGGAGFIISSRHRGRR